MIEKILKCSKLVSLPQELNKIPFAHGIWSWIEAARNQLAARIKSTILLPEAQFSLETTLLYRLSRFCAPSLVLEMRVASMQGVLNGKNATDRYLDFVSRTFSDRDALRAFFEEYKQLAQMVETFLHQWVESSVEFLQRLLEDLPLLEEAFNEGKSLGKVVSLSAQHSDPHHGGRSVILLKFEAGIELVYKPKDLRIVKRFHELLGELSKLGLSPHLSGYRVLAREDYGWEEKVQHLPCVSLEEVKRYYERSGMLLCLLYLLDGTDVHFENLIAAKEMPHLIDLETLFNSYLKDPKREKVHEMTNHSVLSTGMLPRFDFVQGGIKGMDVSGLGNPDGCMFELQRWTGINTDEMELVLEMVPPISAQHQVVYRDKGVQAENYLDEIVLGFRKMYQLICQNKVRLLEKDGWIDRLTEYPVRSVIRPTRFYFYLMNRLSSPEVVLSEQETEKELSALEKYFLDDEREHFRPIVDEEKRSLLQGDIPCLHVLPKQEHLFVKQRIVMQNALSDAAATRVCKRIEEMNQEDCDLQELFIRQSFYAKTNEMHAEDETNAICPQDKSISEEAVLTRIKAIAQDLLERAYRCKDGRLIWISLEANPNVEQFALGRIGFSLYSGKAGIALFFAALWSVVKEEKWREAVFNTLQDLREELKQGHAKHLIANLGIGGMSGIGGVIYGFCKIAQLLDFPAFIEEAKELAFSIEEKHIDQDLSFDIMSGGAGLILALLALYKISRDRSFLTLAKHCGEHLCQHAKEQNVGIGWYTRDDLAYLGFSHGASGIAYALFQLAEETKEVKFADFAFRALAYERSLFNSAQQNWPRLNHQGDYSYPSNWCHGSVGIGFSRIATPLTFQDRMWEDEIQCALSKAKENFFSSSRFSLCCGSCGRFELLFEAFDRNPKFCSEQEVQAAMTSLFCNYETHITKKKDFDGVRELYDPSLMRGAAGIGYTLLRYLNRNCSLPQVLLLET